MVFLDGSRDMETQHMDKNGSFIEKKVLEEREVCVG